MGKAYLSVFLGKRIHVRLRRITEFEDRKAERQRQDDLDGCESIAFMVWEGNVCVCM